MGGGLDRLANNVGIGFNLVGVYYRSDNDEALLLGEAVAILRLEEQKPLHNQSHSYSLTTLSGRRVTSETKGGPPLRRKA